MKKIILFSSVIIFIFFAGKALADLSNPGPVIEVANPVINGLRVEISATATSSCGDIKTTWCKQEHPGKGNGEFEVKWGDGGVSCTSMPVYHDYESPVSYEVVVRSKDTCGYVGQKIVTVLPGATTTPIVATTTSEDVATTTEQKKCASSGEMTSGPVSPEFQFGCCSGLESFKTNNLIGGGDLCYNPANGVPECKNIGTKAEGWYNNIGLLKWDNCAKTNDPEVCTQEYKPVCGEKQVQCIKAPCPPIKQTYGNKCELGLSKASYLYEGVCKEDKKEDNSKIQSAKKQADALVNFKKIFGRNANLKNAKDAWAVNIIISGVKVKQNKLAEQKALSKFIKIYKHKPKSNSDWNIIKAIAYSGVK